jgi:two-component system response regulator QseB
VRLLLAEDDAMIGAAVRQGLQQEGHTVDWVRDGVAADTALRANSYDLLLLDLGLPRRDGLEVLATLRQAGVLLPVIVITARDRVGDRIRGLDLGADDYLVKPFDLDELAARIRSVARRAAGRAEPRQTYGAVTLDPATREVRRDGAPVVLSARELAILEALLERPQAVLSRAQLEERLYGWDEEVASNAVEVHVHHLRRKLGERFIRTLRGLGYTLSEPRPR